MQNDVLKVFDFVADPFLLSKGDDIIFINARAKEVLFPECEASSLTDVFGPATQDILTMDVNGRVEGELFICGAFRPYYAQRVEEYISVLFTRKDDLVPEACHLLTAIDSSFRSPLSMVLMSLRVISRHLDRKNSRELDPYVRTIFQMTCRMLRASGDLCDIAHARSVGQIYSADLQNIADLCAEFTEKAGAYLDKISIRVSMERTGSSVASQIDRRHFERIFYALISFCSGHKGCKNICVHFNGEKDFYTITFSDDGMLDENASVNVKTVPGRLHDQPAVAMDLPLAAAICENYGGTLLIGECKRGNSVSIRMPVRCIEKNILHSPKQSFDTGFDTALIALSDILPVDLYIL